MVSINMEVSMRYIRLLGVLSSLMVGAMLIAPVHSEAFGPTLKVQIDTGPPSTNVGLTSFTCTNNAYTDCYRVTTTTGNTTPPTFISYPSAAATIHWQLQDLDATHPCSVLIADVSGAGNSLDIFTVTGCIFVPTGLTGNAATVSHSLRLIVKNTFDKVLTNGNNPNGTYQLALATGGYFVSGDGSNIYDFVKFEGFGRFDGNTALPVMPDSCTTTYSTATPPVATTTAGCGSRILGSGASNPTELMIQMGGPDAVVPPSIDSFSLGQNVTYPGIDCATPAGSSVCTPTIMLKMTISVRGNDTLYITNSHHAVGGIGKCRMDLDVDADRDEKLDIDRLDHDTHDDGQNVRPCTKTTDLTKFMAHFLKKAAKKDAKSASKAGAVQAIACLVPSDTFAANLDEGIPQCVIADPDIYEQSFT